MTRIINDHADIEAGLTALAARCEIMAGIIPQVIPVPLRRNAPGFASLCRIIIGQQLSIASASAIWLRVENALSPLTPEGLASASDATLAAAGLSRPKQRTLRALAQAAKSGELQLDSLADMDTDAIRSVMTRISGIGPWTASIYAMFSIGHADAFAPEDLALQEAARHAFGHVTRPNARELEKISARWQPWRAVAARVLWANYARLKAREGVIG